MLHRRGGGTRTHVLLSVKQTILPLIYTSVGGVGFEPTTSSTQSSCTTGLCYPPVFSSVFCRESLPDCATFNPYGDVAAKTAASLR